jgi:hypothetical protein
MRSRLPGIARFAGLNLLMLAIVLLMSLAAVGQDNVSSSSSSAKHGKRTSTAAGVSLDAGSVIKGIYQNNRLGLACKIPAGWVLRTEEMNAREEPAEAAAPADGATAASSEGARVLLAAFSRPPDARAEDVNASILIAAENQLAYPGLKDAAQYFGPLTEVAKAQGLSVDEEPYEVAVGTKTLVRGDFHKNVGSRVLHQSTLAMLVHGYAVSITVIAGTEDDVEELIGGLSFSGQTSSSHK